MRHAEKYSHGDKCPDCDVAMTLEIGDNETWQHPSTPTIIYCNECGEEYDVDWNRQDYYCFHDSENENSMKAMKVKTGIRSGSSSVLDKAVLISKTVLCASG